MRTVLLIAIVALTLVACVLIARGAPRDDREWVGRLEVVGDTLVLVVAAAHGPARYELVVPNRQFRAELQAAAGTTVTLVAEPIADVKGEGNASGAEVPFSAVVRKVPVERLSRPPASREAIVNS